MEPTVTYQREVTLPTTAEDAYAWHARPGSFERLRPPWQPVRIIERAHGVGTGERMVMHVRLGPVWRRWVAVHREAIPGHSFIDEQVEGPFAAWRHTHSFEPLDESTCRMIDRVDYRLPLDGPGRVVAGHGIARTIERMFRFRQRRTHDDLQRHAEYAGRPRLRVAVSGASGMIGSELGAFLESGGHEVVRLVRREPRSAKEVRWDPDAGMAPDPATLDGVDAVVHLAGVSLAAGRWTPARRQAIRDSRSDGTRLLVDSLLRMDRPPRTLLSASAIGYYGDRGDEVLTEASGAGHGFLPDVCAAWEASAGRAPEGGIRTAMLRSGLVLSGRGGALTTLLPPFRAALGGPIGGGRQWVSWISLEDWLGAALRLLYDEALEGPVNLTTPQPVTNRELVGTIGTVLRRPARVPLPAAAVRLGFGEMGEHLLLDSARVLPARLTDAGFSFLYPDLEGALRAELGLSTA